MTGMGWDGFRELKQDLKNELTLRDKDIDTLQEAGLPAAIKENRGRWLGENMTTLRGRSLKIRLRNMEGWQI